jgi:probable F420-dependent oxidoreductase
MRFWQCITYSHPRELTALARTIEQAGFDGVTVAEHVFYPQQLQSEHPYSDSAFESTALWSEVWTSIAAMAAVTEHVLFTTAVNVLPMFNPYQYAKTLATLAHLANDRVIVGAGAGWMKEEFDAMNVDFRTRGKRYDEMIALIRELWREGPTTFKGEFFQCEEVLMLPPPVKSPPIWIGGKSEIALRRAARLGDGWMGTGETLPESFELAQRVHELRKEYGRDHLPFGIMTIQPVGSYSDDDYARMQQLGFTDIVNWTFPFVMKEHNPSLEQKQEYLLTTGAALRSRFG